MKALIEILQPVAKNAGIEPPSGISSNDADQILMIQFVNEAGNEVARRVDWGVLRQSVDITGTGLSSLQPLPADFDRTTIGLAVKAGDAFVRGSLTADEWRSLPSTIGRPRYFYLTGGNIGFYPAAALGEVVQVAYQSNQWAQGGKASLSQAGDSPLISDELLSMGAIWRWRRHVGKDFSDYLAEFESALADAARNDGGVRQP